MRPPLSPRAHRLARLSAGALAALASGLTLWRILEKAPPAPQGSLRDWTSKDQKLAAARALNASVRLQGFKAWVHKAEPGDNFWTLARRHGLDLDTLIGLNPDLPGLSLRLGRPLLLANGRGALHQVEPGETLESIARRHGKAGQDLERANRLGLFDPEPGSLLFVPQARSRQLSQGLATAYKRRGLFRSPLSGRLSSGMGRRSDPFSGAASHHDGIDIAAAHNDWVGAAAPGRVAFAGWNGGFGKCVKLNHGNGYTSLYGHLNAIKVSPGQKVLRHQFLGRVGSTGRATGPHLHFSIYSRGKAVNPLDYLW